MSSKSLIGPRRFYSNPVQHVADSSRRSSNLPQETRHGGRGSIGMGRPWQPGSWCGGRRRARRHQDCSTVLVSRCSIAPIEKRAPLRGRNPVAHRGDLPHALPETIWANKTHARAGRPPDSGEALRGRYCQADFPWTVGSVVFLHKRMGPFLAAQRPAREVRWSFDLRYKPHGRADRPAHLFPPAFVRAEPRQSRGTELRDPRNAGTQMWLDAPRNGCPQIKPRRAKNDVQFRSLGADDHPDWRLSGDSTYPPSLKGRGL